MSSRVLPPSISFTNGGSNIKFGGKCGGKHKMDENTVSFKFNRDIVDKPVTKREIAPLSDTQISTPINHSKYNKIQESQSSSKLNGSTYVAKKIDINKELQSFKAIIEQDTVPISNCAVLPPNNPPVSFESISNDLQHSISEFRSFLQSELSTFSDRIASSSSSPSLHSSSQSTQPEVTQQILQIVQTNQRMLTELLHPVESASHYQSLLHEEEKKTQTLTNMLTSCIADNDALASTVESLRQQLQVHADAEMEYTLLYQAARQDVQHTQSEMKRLEDCCAQWKQEVQQLTAQVQQLTEAQQEKTQKELPKSTELTAGELKEQLNSYKFTNQLLVQQLADERKRTRESEEEGKKRVRMLEEEKEALQKENEEMKLLLSKTNHPDFQFIEDSSDES